MSTEYTGESTRRRTYTLLTGIILLTLPCYCAGFIALALAPQPQPTNAPPPAGTTGGVNPLTPGGSTLVPLLTQTAFVFPSATSLTQLPTFTPGPAAGTFQFTPTQFIPPTRTPTPTITNTPTPTITNTPTNTITPTPSGTSSATIPATSTETAVPPLTFTPSATQPPAPTATLTPSATLAASPTATDTLAPSETPTETPTP